MSNHEFTWKLNSRNRKEERGMKKNSNIDIEEKEINLEENRDNKKKKLVILLVAIFILSLITTGLTTNIFGRIGTAFKNEGSFVLKNSEDNASEVIKNQELVFDSKTLNISLSDSSGKLSYSYDRIVPSEYTCETGDAKVATCYPANGYVVIYPKGVGKTTVTLRTEANGKVYAATSEVVVGEAERYIELASNKGTINLNTNKNKEVAYYLVGMSGNVSATSSNESVATVSVKNGVLKITASKVGKTEITVSLTYNNQIYTSVYKLEVVNEVSHNNEKPVNRKKSRISTLSKLTVSNVDLKFNSSTTSYSVVIDKNVKTIDIDYEKTNENAKVIYTIDGMASTSLKNIPLREGAKEIIITVISEDGSSTTSYKIAINRVDSDMTKVLEEVTLNGMLLSATSPTTYNAKVGADVDKVDLGFKVNGNNTVHYELEGNVQGTGSVVTDLSLKLGKNTIKVTVKNKFGINIVFFITIEREAPSNNTDIHLDILDDGYSLDQDDDNHYSIKNIPFEKDDISLSVACVDPDCKKISYEITYDDGTKKTLDDLKNVPLKDGNNTIAITVIAEDGKTTDTHYVNIYRPVRRVKFDNSSNKVIVEKEFTDIPYTIEEFAEDGTTTKIELDNPKDVLAATLEKYNNKDDVIIEVHQGFIRVIPKNPRKIVGNNDTLTLKYVDKESTTILNFDIDEYDLSSSSTSYDMTNSKGGNTRSIILNTTLVESTDATLDIDRSSDGKRLTICDKDKIHCVNVEVDSTQDDGDITLSYGSDSTTEIGPNDLPITITANGDGLSKIKVSGNVYGKSIEKDFTIDINVTRKYLITVYANIPGEDSAKFNAATKVWKDEISKDQQLDLSVIPEPSKIVDCEYYKFKHYTTNLDTKELTYDRETHKMIDGSTLTDDLDIYAIYEENPTEDPTPETNSLWLKASDYAEGLPLFHNEEYFTKYNEDKVIYPGVEGSYVMKFTAEDDMNLIGLVLKENTICVDGKCLNMGYRVRYNEIRYNEPVGGKDYESFNNYLLPKLTSPNVLDSGYWILNQNYGIMSKEVTYLDESNNLATVLPNFADVETENRTDVEFDTPISLKSGDQISMTIFWKWVEVDDAADTAIGEYAATDGADINDKYSLSVGIIYEPVDVCPTD